MVIQLVLDVIKFLMKILESSIISWRKMWAPKWYKSKMIMSLNPTNVTALCGWS